MELIKQNTQAQIIKSILVIFLGSVLLAVSAKIKIPFYPVPMTMQTFVVLFIGISFGYKIGVATIGLYLIEGIVFGILWLGTLIGWDKPIFDLGVKPFLLAEIFKIALLVLIAKKIFKFRKLI